MGGFVIFDILLFVGQYLIILLYTIYAYFEYLYKKFSPTRSLKSLSNEIVLVTGSGRGIGREICLELSRQGATVVCWSRTEKPNREVLKKIQGQGGRAFAYTVDVADRKQVELMAKRVRKEVGEVTMVVNNAGLMKILPLLETSPEDIRAMFDVNVLSNFWVIREFLPAMIERGTGHIVSVCSASGLLATRYIAPYSSTKHAVTGYMESLRDEMLHHPNRPKIAFTTAFPFYCKTEMLDEGVPHSKYQFLFPIVTPESVAVSVVEGIRKELDYIYIPNLIGWLAMFSWLVTRKAVTAHGDFLEVHIEPLANNEN